jgi:cytochrome c biogenesis protein ResB
LALDHTAIRLPFSVRLDRFERETYPGTDQAAMFASHVTLTGDGIDGERTATIRMNQPLKFGGYTFFQSGFDRNPMRTVSILTVSRDPGKWAVYSGFCLVCVGVILMVIAKRRGRQSATAAAVAPGSIEALANEGRVACAA